MRLWRGAVVVAIGISCLVQAGSAASLVGKVYNQRGAGVWGAKVWLKSAQGSVYSTDVLGNFQIPNVGIRHTPAAPVQNIPLVFNLTGRTINFQTSHAGVGKISLFTPAGKEVVSISLGNVAGGMHTASLPALSSGLYILNLRVGSALFSGPVVNANGNMRMGQKSCAAPTGITPVPRSAALLYDSLIVSKGGYATRGLAVFSPYDSVKDTLQDACPAFTVPDSLHFDSVMNMPDPFKSLDGTRLTDKDQWTCRRAQISALMQQYEYGPYPPAPDSVRATYSGTSLTVKVYYQGRNITITSTVKLPSGTDPCGAYVGIGGFPGSLSSQLPAANVATLSYSPTSVASDAKGQGGTFYTLYTTSSKTGVLMAWAWGVHRLLDGLYAIPRIDPLRVGVTGTSRYGKGALVTGAFDERICVTMPHCGGSGASESWRIALKGNSPPISNNASVQTLNEVTNEAPWWWVSTFKANFALKEWNLPFDAHEGLALVAPRALLVLECTGDYWNCPSAVWNGSKACQQVYRFLGLTDNMGFASCPGGHATFDAHMDTMALRFANRFINGQSVSTTCFDTTNISGSVPNQTTYPNSLPYYAIRDTFGGPKYWTAPGFTTW